MSQSANVRSIEALGELQSALNRYQTEAYESLLVVEAEILRTREWLQERLNDWQKELRRREEFLKQAQEALRACETQAYRDPESGRVYVPDCSRQQAAVRQARRLVDEAIVELQTVQYHIKRVEEAVSAYQAQANRLRDALRSDLPKGVALLGRSKGILDSYVGGGGGGAIDAGSSGSSAPTATSQNTVDTSLPFIPTGGKIGDTGLQMTALADIDLSDSSVTGPTDFKKGIPPDQMKEGLHKLQSVVLPALARGEGRDFLVQLDAAQGLENADTYSNIYDVYFDPKTCIHLERVGGQLKVMNGFHRLFIARQLGITHLPALIDSPLP